jgi:flagellar biosynthesis/type III secretory pathway M-ring protein FliF/YscJ
MKKQLIILLLLTTLSFSITIEEAMMIQYGSYISASALLIILLIAFLLYWTIHYKKLVKNLKSELNQKEATLNSLKETIQESELAKVKDEHKFEKEISDLKQEIKNLDEDLKKGLKSQVVSKIEEYQTKRTKQMDRLSIKA